MILLLIAVAFFECHDDPFKHSFIHSNQAERLAKLPGHFFFTNILFRTFALITRAVVVNVSSLLDLCRECTAAMAAEYKSLEGPLVRVRSSPAVSLVTQ